MYLRLANITPDDEEIPPSLLATCALKYLEDLPPGAELKVDITRLKYVLKRRYSSQNVALPSDILSAFVLFDFMEMDYPLLRDLRHHGPQITQSLNSVKDFLSHYRPEELDAKQVAAALLLMILSPARQRYSPSLFISVVHDPNDTDYWDSIVQEFDLNGLEISKDQFLPLFNCLLPLAQENPRFDIQKLWGGQWRHPQTQLAFLRSFLSCSHTELDARTVPNLHQAYDPRDTPHISESDIERASHDPMISLDAISTTLDLLLRPDDLPSQEEEILLAEIIGAKEGLFLCSCIGLPKPWSEGQQYVMKSLLLLILKTDRPDNTYVLRTLWKQDKHFVAMCLIEIHLKDPLELAMILDQAEACDMLEDLLTLLNGFGLDLAALAHRKGLHDLDQWAEAKLAQDPNVLVSTLSRFLLLKAQDELRTARDEQPVPRTVSLAMKTVYSMLNLLDTHMADRVELKALQRQCLQAYPRLIIFSEGIEENIDVDCKESNRLPRTADEEMQELYKNMYNEALRIETVIERLQEWRASEEPKRLDVFACMIHGLFDEFSCFGEYPTAPLKMTALLFAGIISFRLISNLTLQVAQEMILDSVRDYPQETSMFKFGVQVLLNIQDRFQEPDWIDFCSRLVQIPGLRGTDPHAKALQLISEHGSIRGGSDEGNVNGLTDGLPNGEIDSFLSPDTVPEFKSISAEPASPYDDPHEDVQEKVVFFFNNVSPQNVKSKIIQLQEVLHTIQPQWFASFLVDGRAKLEENNQSLYLDILNLINNKAIYQEVLRETYFSIRKLLNAESTMQSPAERKNLKHLSKWLGSLTLARDKPIKHRNISFIDFLIEGVETQRLNLVIPTTCNILIQGRNSVVFRPPNPWVTEIAAALLELYFHFDVKLNHKFEIEVLFSELGLQVKQGEESDLIRNRPHDENMTTAILPDGPNGFIDMSLGGMEPARNSRFEIGSMSSALPDLEALLKFPPPSGSAATQAKLHAIVHEAVKQAVLEIILPVVERSVTIATIATSALIHKDFARESDEERVRRSAQQMAGQLSGSLALVTCKEPLKVSMTNNIRKLQAELPDQVFPEGAILMCVNDNLDTACDIVEKQAEERSMPEIEAHIEAEIASRRQHRSSNPTEPFQDPAYSHWSNFIPDPYKQSFNGLNQEQMAIYLEFARQSRGPPSHGQSGSADSGRQLPDVLQDAFTSIPNIHTPATDLSMPYQPPQQSQQTQQPNGRMLPPPLHGSMPLNQVNGFSPIGAIHDQLQDLLGEISRLIKEDPNRTMSQIQREAPAIVENLNRAWEMITASPDSIAMTCAEDICKAVYGDSMTRLEIEVFVTLLARLYQVYPGIRREVAMWAATQTELKLFNVDVTIPLVKADIMPIKQVDASMAGLLYDRIDGAVEFMAAILHALLLNERPTALRADFAYSLGALGQLVAESPNLKSAKDLYNDLKDWAIEDMDKEDIDARSLIKKRQLQYIFAEWNALCNSYPKSPSDQVFSVFVYQLHKQRQLETQEDMALFLRLSLDDAIESYTAINADVEGFSTEALCKVDWLARLVVLLVKHQGDLNGSIQQDKAEYFDSILSLLTLILNHYHNIQGEHFSQRLFFRLYSTILCEWFEFARENDEQEQDMLLVFAANFLALSPRFFPAFTNGWLMLISHRLFMPGLLRLGNDKVKTPILSSGCILTDKLQAWEAFSKMMEEAFSYIGHLQSPNVISPVSTDLYRSLLRIVLILHHDFPEFLAENHFRLCNAIPRHCTQFHNLVLSAIPPSSRELPNPFISGLKVDRLEEMRRSPNIRGDYTKQLARAHVKEVVDSSLRDKSISNDKIALLASAMYNTAGKRKTAVNVSLLHALILYIGQSATDTFGQKGTPSFDENSAAAMIVTRLMRELHPAARYYLISAIVHQLRYPNSHTQYFTYTLFHLFGADQADPQSVEIREQITRVIIERSNVVSPHPWGLLVTILELVRNPDYGFFKQPYITANPGVSDVIYEIIDRLQ